MKSTSSLIVLIILAGIIGFYSLKQVHKPVTGMDSGGDEFQFEIKLVDPVFPEKPRRIFQVHQVNDKRDFPNFYYMDLRTEVCQDNVCKPVAVKLFWDALGRYKLLTCPDDEPLTKTDDAPFSANDYVKLDRALKDTQSILGQYSIKEIIKGRDASVDDVDGVTGATPVSVQKVVVRHAAYTTWALWQWAHGEIVDILTRRTHSQASEAFWLDCLKTRDDPEKVRFALSYLLESDYSSPSLIESAYAVMERAGRITCQAALAYLKQAVNDKTLLQERLADSLGSNGGADRLILEYFVSNPPQVDAVLEKMAVRLGKMVYFRDIGAILDLLESQRCYTESVRQSVAKLKDSSEPVIVNAAEEFLRQMEQQKQE